MTAEELRATASQFYWYHTVDLGQGVVINGDYDMSEYLPHYHFPNSMQGMRVLDVGRASGYFSFEFERRGASVVATEIGSFLDWDFFGGQRERDRKAKTIGDADEFTVKYITGAFNFAHKTRQSAVRPVTVNIYDLCPDVVGSDFNLVFAGALTSHLRSPILGFERLFSVVAPGGTLIVSAPYFGADEAIPLAAIVGSADMDRRSWWVLNKRCLTEMLVSVGFTDVRIVSEFDLKLRRPDAQATVFPHIVAHART